MSGYCSIHLTSPLDQYGQCNTCLWIEHDRNKLAKKESAKKQKSYSKKIIALDKAKNKHVKVKSLNQQIKDAQSALSSWFKKTYCKNKYVNCCICKIPVLVYGNHIMNTIHCSHYFPKGIYWGLMFMEENLSECCYNCNVNNPQSAPAMRNHLVSRFGEDRIKALELQADQFLIKVKTKQLKSRPDELFLLGNIQELKTK